MNTASISELIEVYESGEITRSEMHYYIELKFTDQNIDELISKIPKEYKSDFINELQKTYGREHIPDESFYFLHDKEGNGPRVAKVVRQWLRRNEIT